MPACARRVRRRSPPLPLDPPSKAPGSSSLGLSITHDLHAISQPDKPLINIRLIHHFLQCGMWIITDFSVCTGMTRALPGKCPLLVPARLRNPQHFHRLCTGLAPLRTSHPHVCAQTAGKQSCRRLAGSSGSARAPVLVGPASAPRVRCPRHAGPIARPLPGRTGVRRCRAHVVCRWEPGREPGCALVGTDMIKVLANRKPLPAADSCRILCNLSVAAGILVVGWRRTSISVRCGPTANRRLLKLNLARLVWQAGKRCYRRRPRRR